MPMDYDTWLEAPFQRAAAEAEAYWDFCEERDLDCDSDEAQEAWEAFQREEEDFLAELTLDERERADDRY